ncbi:MAG: beta-ketoacyl synthase N-terminal-like domain-containing protein [Clostridium sp.]
MKMKTTNSRLVITGMGAVTPIGIGVENYWKNLVAGKCGVEAITRFDTEELRLRLRSKILMRNFMPKKRTREMDVFMQYGYAAAMEAIADAEGRLLYGRMGIVVGGTWRYFTDCRSAGWLKQGRA